MGGFIFACAWHEVVHSPGFIRRWFINQKYPLRRGHNMAGNRADSGADNNLITKCAVPPLSEFPATPSFFNQHNSSAYFSQKTSACFYALI
ncbi:hypothetical protein ABEH32_11680 [Pantoea agglomerans]|uniref:hypothetical protein n=1 Tax=Enterobacter agglomerans TaxID=549 RepID=UPI0016542200|nr:hypothetical protein [Pantoea agglomerans]